LSASTSWLNERSNVVPPEKRRAGPHRSAQTAGGALV
jgi:hypothetical protein